jgi:antitoxin (DNA-binding transcriptional repressor) of toxin-antitoxin stability system
MKTLTATDVSRNFSHVLDDVIFRGEEITITRNKRAIAKLVPGTPHLTAIEALADVYSTIDPGDGKEWIEDIESLNKSMDEERKDPWG